MHIVATCLALPCPHSFYSFCELQVPKPNKEEHEKELAELTAALDKLKEERQAIQAKIDETLDKNKNTGIGKERDELQKLRSSKNALIEEKKAIRAKLDQARNEADKIMKDRKDARSNIRFTNVEEIDAEIAKLHRKQETTTMSLTEEKKLIKEIDALKNSKKFVATLKDKETAMDDVKAQRKTIQELIAAKDKEIDGFAKQIEDKMIVIKSMNEKDSEKRDKLQGWFKERDELRQKFSDKLKEKDALRADFREKNNAWYNFQRALRAQKKMQYEEEKKKREEEHQAYLKKIEEEEAKKIPYEEEQALCDYLADYLTNTYLSDKSGQQGDEKKKDEVVAVKEDPFAGFKPVTKKSEDEYFGKGKGKKKRDRANKKQDKKDVGPFTLSVDTFEQFGLIGLNPPTALDQVETSVKDLREKKEWYSKQPRGSVPTAHEIRKANERAAEKLRQNGNTAEKAQAAAAAPKAKGKFALSNDDFAPLPGSNASSNAPVSLWGKPANLSPPTAQSTGADPTPEEAAQS